jgi:uncharacterized protein YjbJ (UPF0337 family)
MTWAEIETNWDTFAPQLQERWGRLTDDDLIAAREGADKLLNCVLKRYRIDSNVAKRHVDDWINSASELSIIATRGMQPMQVEAPEVDRPSA